MNSKLVGLCLLISLSYLFPDNSIMAQKDLDHNEFDLHQEMPDQPYLPPSKQSPISSPAFHTDNGYFFCTQVNVNALHENMLRDAANEPSLAIDPTNPNRMVIGWRQFDNVASNFRQAGYAFSNDGGNTWTFNGVIEPGVFRSDPVLDVDANGQFYYNSLTVRNDNFFCNVYGSESNNSWNEGTFALGGDKQWMAIDRSGGNGDGNIYVYWNRNFSFCEPDHFTRSIDKGKSFENCIALPQPGFWGTNTIGSDGTLYIGAYLGSSRYLFTRSRNAQNSSNAILWDLEIVFNLGGRVLAGRGSNSIPNPGGLHGQVWIAVDQSNTSRQDYLYVLGTITPANDVSDVHFVRSVDGGNTWSTPIRVNDDTRNDAWQWMGTMSIAPNGRLDAVWLDTRDDPGGLNSSLYYANSEDGGITWSENQRLSESFDPHLGWPNQNKMGDYFDMESTNTQVHIAWAGTFNGEQDVYYGRIDLTKPVATQNQTSNNNLLPQNYPNPFTQNTNISFRLNKPALVTLTIYNVQGQIIKTLVNENLASGDYCYTWSGVNDNEQPVNSGIYFYQINVGERYKLTRKLIFAKY